MTRAPERGTRTCTPAMHSITTRPQYSADKPAAGGGSPSGGATGGGSRETCALQRAAAASAAPTAYFAHSSDNAMGSCLPYVGRWQDQVTAVAALAAETAMQQTYLADVWEGDDGCANVKVPHCARKAQAPRPDAQRPRTLGAGGRCWPMGCSTGQHCLTSGSRTWHRRCNCCQSVGCSARGGLCRYTCA